MSRTAETIDYGERGQVRVVEDAAALASEAAELFVSVVTRSVAKSGFASIALSGGSTPKQMGMLLAQDHYRERVPWRNLHVFWGDERWVPIESPESNAGEAKRTFLDSVSIPDGQVYPFQTADVSPEESASVYEALVRAVVGSNGGTPVFDLIFLGMGEDGHTASLFPGTTAVHEQERLVLAHLVPKLAATRLTMTPPLLNAGKTVVFLAAGVVKAERLRDVLEGPVSIDDLPSQVVRTTGGPIWMVDRAAVSKLTKQPE